VDDRECKFALALAQIMPGLVVALRRCKVPEALLVLAGGLVCLALWRIGR